MIHQPESYIALKVSTENGNMRFDRASFAKVLNMPFEWRTVTFNHVHIEAFFRANLLICHLSNNALGPQIRKWLFSLLASNRPEVLIVYNVLASDYNLLLDALIWFGLFNVDDTLATSADDKNMTLVLGESKRIAWIIETDLENRIKQDEAKGEL